MDYECTEEESYFSKHKLNVFGCSQGDSSLKITPKFGMNGITIKGWNKMIEI